MEVTENSVGVHVSLTPAVALKVTDASAYWRKALKLREEPLRLTPSVLGSYFLEARGVAGFIKIDDLNLEIAPKFLDPASCGPGWRSAMWRFLAYGHGVEALTDAQGSDRKDDGIADVLADMFLTSLRGASARGYPLGYAQVRQSSAFLRGRLDPQRYKDLIPVSGKIGVIASQLTRDTATNQLLKWAGLQLAAAVEDPRRRQHLLAWSAELSGVQPSLPRGLAVPPPRRHHPYLVHAIEIAKLLRDDRLAGYQQGELSLPGFLWDSENLFERAVRRIFSEACRPLGFAVSKNRVTLASTTHEGKVRSTYTTPDVTLSRRGLAQIHADAKYKVLAEHPINDDFYQVLAAGRVSGIDTVALIYPTFGQGLATKLYEPAGEGRPKYVFTASVGLESFVSRRGVRHLQEQLRGHVADWISKAP